MRSLFLKILLWFWLTFAIVLVTLLTITFSIRRKEINNEARLRLELHLPVEVKQAAEIYEKEGRVSLQSHFDRMQRGGIIRPYFLDEKGNDLLGRTPPVRAVEFARTAKFGPSWTCKAILWNIFAAQRAIGASGRSYTMLVVITHPSVAILHTVPDLRTSRILLTILVVGGTFCFWLAHHIAKPVEQLSKTASRIAEGDLDARTDKSISSRQDEIGRLGRSFDCMAEQIESLVRGQQRLLRDVSHELRSPLARLSLSEGLLRQCPPEEREEYLDRIELEVQHLDQLIGQLLTLARIDSGTDASCKENIELSTLVQEVAVDGNFEAQARHRSVKISSLELCPIAGAEEQLRRAVENVVRNAIRYTQPCTDVEITLSRQSTPAIAVIQVRDHGPGIAAEHLCKIFLPFYRVATTCSEETGNSGLGLAITERIMRMHGGNVSAENAADGGLIVRLELPLIR